jgi:hypothetical protein
VFNAAANSPLGDAQLLRNPGEGHTPVILQEGNDGAVKIV